jgi:CheY-like chemotaxis protein
MKTLIVEDNPTDLKLMHTVLQMEGHEVIDALSAEEAVRLLQKNLPQIILIDLQLPRMDGMALGRQLKQNSATAGIPTIAITADPDYYSKREATEAGFAAYFVKPINTRTISHQMAEILHHE